MFNRLPILVDCTYLMWLRILMGYRKYDTAPIERKISEAWLGGKSGFCLPVTTARSGLDLFLQSIRLPPGSEFLVSGINIPDMLKILQGHGIKVVPVDLDFHTLAVDLNAIKNQLTSKTRGILIAHIYGALNAIDPVIEFAKQHGLVVVEDAAESYGIREYVGHPEADLVLFSFGLIKTNTALSGGVCTVYNRELFHKMKAIRDTYEYQSKRYFARRLLVALLFMVFQSRCVVNLYMRTTKYPFLDVRDFIIQQLRGFPNSSLGLQKYRTRPSPVLLNSLLLRLSSFDFDGFNDSMNRIRRFAKSLNDASISVAGMQADLRNFWLFPIMRHPSTSVDAMCDLFRAMGVGASPVSSQLAVVGDGCPVSTRLMQDAVYLPIHKNVTEGELRKIERITKQIYKNCPNLPSPIPSPNLPNPKL